MKNLFTIIFVLVGFSSAALAEGVCEDSNRREVCLKMRHLRASINALDAQRELMQVNPSFFASMGVVLYDTALKAKIDYGIGIPEHIMGLSGVERLSSDLTAQAVTGNVDMLKTANMIRNQCATCHASSGGAGGVDWENIFKYDWDAIVKHCNSSERNPYLCRSMNGMLSSYGYLLTAYEAKMPSFSMTRHAADEVTRILVDLKEKGFYHLPEEWRSQAEAEAREVSQMAQAQDPGVFERAAKITNACQKCHERTGGGPVEHPLNLRKLNWNRAG